MRAARLIAPKRWEIAEVERPEPTRDMMLVRLERAGICGTDKPAFCGVGTSYPMEVGQTGHEGLGIVEACPTDAFIRAATGCCSGASTGACSRNTCWPIRRRASNCRRTSTRKWR